MQAFLYIDLSGATTYENSLLLWIRRSFPGVTTFDVDARSDATLQQHAVKLLQEMPESIVCVKGGEADLGNIMVLLEELFQPQPLRLIFLLGDQPRLLRMLQARPQVRYSVVADEGALIQYLELFT